MNLSHISILLQPALMAPGVSFAWQRGYGYAFAQELTPDIHQRLLSLTERDVR